MIRQPTDDEIEDAWIETLMEHRARDRQMTAHSYDPTCGCAACDPLAYVDDQSTEEREWDEDQAQIRYEQENGY